MHICGCCAQLMQLFKLHFCFRQPKQASVFGIKQANKWWAVTDLNCGPKDYESVYKVRYRPALPSKSTTYVIPSRNRQASSSYAVDTLLTLFRILLASMKNANYINTGITYAVNQDVVWMNYYFAACRHARTAYK
jgi:hypothetical protein